MDDGRRCVRCGGGWRAVKHRTESTELLAKHMTRVTTVTVTVALRLESVCGVDACISSSSSPSSESRRHLNLKSHGVTCQLEIQATQARPEFSSL
eukprot:3230647-Rhodomonas_salina.4